MSPHTNGSNEYEAAIEELTDVAPEGTTNDEVRSKVDHPSHYKDLRIEPIDVIEAWALDFCLGNAVKYIARHALKGMPKVDLAKARWYLDRAIASRGGEVQPYQNGLRVSESELAKAKARISLLESALGQAKAQCDEAFARLKDRRTPAQEDLDDAIRERDQAHDHNYQLKAELQRLESVLDETNRELIRRSQELDRLRSNNDVGVVEKAKAHGVLVKRIDKVFSVIASCGPNPAPAIKDIDDILRGGRE